MVKLDKIIRRKNRKVILFADISGSSALYKKYGNIKAKDVIDSLLDAIKKLVKEAKGSVIKTIGDEVMACFDDCDKCLLASVAMQQQFSLVLARHKLQVSVGVGFGEVLSDKGDLFGEAVNDSAHLTKLAKGGQILLSESVWSQLSSQSQSNVREFDRIKFKGAEESSLIYRVYWQEGKSRDSETKLMSGKFVGDEELLANLTIEYRDAINTISQKQTPFIIGRDSQKCDLLVEGSQVSREHCQIDFRRGKFVLIDHSTNGCYLVPTGKDEFYIRREEYPLIEATILSLGIPAEQANEEAIQLYY